MRILSVFTKNGRQDIQVPDNQVSAAASIIKNPMMDAVDKVRELADLSNKLTKKQEWLDANKVEKISFTDVDGR